MQRTVIVSSLAGSLDLGAATKRGAGRWGSHHSLSFSATLRPRVAKTDGLSAFRQLLHGKRVLKKVLALDEGPMSLPCICGYLHRVLITETLTEGRREKSQESRSQLWQAASCGRQPLKVTSMNSTSGIHTLYNPLFLSVGVACDFFLSNRTQQRWWNACHCWSSCIWS